MVVPQNSLTQMRQKLGLMEYETLSGQRPNSFQNQAAKANTHCPHCENMAKNFLYLESLVRSNYITEEQCCLCNATLKYLQYVNKNIAEVFGNFDSIVQASKAFTIQAKSNIKPPPQQSRVTSKQQHKVPDTAEETPKKSSTKHRFSKGKAKSIKLTPSTPKQTPVKRMTGGGGSVGVASTLRVNVNTKTTKARSKNSLRKVTVKKGDRSAVVKRKERIAEDGAFENGAKVLKKQKQHSKLKLKSSSRMLRALKPKNIKSKQSKNKNLPLHANK